MSVSYCPKCAAKQLQKRVGDERYRCGKCGTRFMVLFESPAEPPVRETFDSPLYGESDTLENIDVNIGKGRRKGGAI